MTRPSTDRDWDRWMRLGDIAMVLMMVSALFLGLGFLAKSVALFVLGALVGVVAFGFVIAYCCTHLDP